MFRAEERAATGMVTEEMWTKWSPHCKCYDALTLKLHSPMTLSVYPTEIIHIIGFISKRLYYIAVYSLYTLTGA